MTLLFNAKVYITSNGCVCFIDGSDSKIIIIVKHGIDTRIHWYPVHVMQKSIWFITCYSTKMISCKSIYICGLAFANVTGGLIIQMDYRQQSCGYPREVPFIDFKERTMIIGSKKPSSIKVFPFSFLHFFCRKNIWIQSIYLIKKDKWWVGIFKLHTSS